MNIQLLCKQWAEYEHLVPFKAVSKLLTLPQSFMEQDIQTILPNIELATDGPVIRSLIFISADYIGEVRLGDETEDFDFALRHNVMNYRIQLGQHKVIRNAASIDAAKAKGESPPNPETIDYQTATMLLQHPDQMRTTISYFGKNRDEWLASAKSAIPVDLLKHSR